MIAIPTILSKYEKIFDNARWLIILLYNCLKKDIIKVSGLIVRLNTKANMLYIKQISNRLN